MKILITGICGFAGSEIALGLGDALEGVTVIGLDNLSRPGSHEHRTRLRLAGLTVHHGDVRSPSDLENLPACDWVIDASANPSVLAGLGGPGGTTSRQVVEHNLLGTVNLLETCRRWQAGFVLLSTSRVYSIRALGALPLEESADAFALTRCPLDGGGYSPAGIAETFPTTAPVSLYGATKLASETLALEYGSSYGFPVWINRCGVLAGAGQFGRPDQGIFSFWIHSWKQKRPLRYIGFGGRGHQVRDCLHPRDLLTALTRQMREPAPSASPSIINLSGGLASARSLCQVSTWCAGRFGPHEVGAQPEDRPNDIPWVVLDHTLATRTWDWRPSIPVETIFEEIARQAEARPDWLDLSSG
ncbi:MAG: NAD-dependent epimerase/dehydratase family protein [Opitutaceae bacterium]